MTVDIRNAGRRYGHLVVAYTDISGRKVTCYCDCSRQVKVAIAPQDAFFMKPLVRAIAAAIADEAVS